MLHSQSQEKKNRKNHAQLVRGASVKTTTELSQESTRLRSIHFFVFFSFVFCPGCFCFSPSLPFFFLCRYLLSNGQRYSIKEGGSHIFVVQSPLDGAPVVIVRGGYIVPLHTPGLNTAAQRLYSFIFKLRCRKMSKPQEPGFGTMVGQSHGPPCWSFCAPFDDVVGCCRCRMWWSILSLLYPFLFFLCSLSYSCFVFFFSTLLILLSLASIVCLTLSFCSEGLIISRSVLPTIFLTSHVLLCKSDAEEKRIESRVRSYKMPGCFVFLALFVCRYISPG